MPVTSSARAPRPGGPAAAFSRRRALALAAAAPLAAALPRAATAAARPLHEEVAARARALSAGGPSVLRLLLPRGSEANVVPVIAAFHAATGIAVETVSTEVDDINTVLSLDALAGGGTYDLALPATSGLPDLAASGALVPLGDFARRHEPPGFRDAILYSTGDSFDREIYGFQTDGDAYVMFYNADMLRDPAAQRRYHDRFGRPLDIPQTWQDLDRQMAFFHDPDAGRYGGLLFRTPGYVAWEFWVRFHARGLWPLSRDLAPQIQGAEGIGALTDLVAATRWQCPEVRNLGLFENWERFSRGDVYCNIGWGGSQKYFNASGSPLKGRLAFGPTPGGIVDESLLVTPYFNWGWNYVVTASSRVPELAYLFALFAATPEISTRSVARQEGFFDPFRPEHYAHPAIRAAYSPEFLEVHRASLETAIPDLYLKDQSSYFRVLSEEISRVLAGEAGAEEALERVARHWDVLTLRAGPERQRARWLALRAKYPAAIRARLRDL